MWTHYTWVDPLQFPPSLQHTVTPQAPKLQSPAGLFATQGWTWNAITAADRLPEIQTHVPNMEAKQWDWNMWKTAKQEVTIGGLQAGCGQRTCFLWPSQCSEDILISCQSHEISQKNVDFWLLLKNRKSGKLALTPTWQPGTIPGRWLPSVEEAGIPHFPIVSTASYCPTPGPYS